jgi:hypothetical protein
MPLEESGELPDGHLELQHAYGYAGWTRGALALSASGEVVYPASCLCIIASVRAQASTQRFFAGHTSEVSALALHPSGSLCASGQSGLAPYVCVWDIATSHPLATLRGVHSKGISCLAFSADGRVLASLGADAQHTLALYDWESTTLLARAHAGLEHLSAIAFSPDGGLATAGAMHLKYWGLEAAAPAWSGAAGRAPASAPRGAARPYPDLPCRPSSCSLVGEEGEGRRRREVVAFFGWAMLKCRRGSGVWLQA